jgi:hypothetical protein
MSWESTLDEQIALKRWWGTTEAHAYARAFLDSVTTKYPSGDADRGYAALTEVEPRKLELADPVWISPDVCALIEAARQADPPFEPEPLLPSDLPCVYGFLRFDTPMHLTDARGKTVNVTAMAWMPVVDDSWEGPGDAPWDRQGIDLTLYSDRDDMEDTDLDDLRERRFGSRFVLLHRMPWWFGKTLEDSHFATGDPEQGGLVLTDDEAKASLADWLLLMQITLRLIQQKITSSGKTRLPRGFRKRAEREGFDPYTVVITLRRYESKQRSGEGYQGDGPYYSHRFVVSGGWRNQYYPSLGSCYLEDGSPDPASHRQLYIHSYIKGPEDAELIIKPSRAIEVVR